MVDEKAKPEKKQAEKTPPKEAQEPAKKEAKKCFVVCDGKNITSKRGILSGGDPVSSEILSGGKAALDSLVKAGYVK